MEVFVASATMPVSDSRFGKGGDRTAFFSTPGAFALTFEISDLQSPAFAFDLAFAEPAQAMALGGSPWSLTISCWVAESEGYWLRTVCYL
jgi:hypothetical protein